MRTMLTVAVAALWLTTVTVLAVADDAEMGPGVAEYAPHEALFAGPEGLDSYRRLAPQLGKLLSPGGLAAIEVGFEQANSATALFKAQGMEPHVATDFGGRVRTLLIRG